MRSISCYLSHKRLLAMLTRTLTRTLLGSVLCLTVIEMVGNQYSLARETRSGVEIAQVVPVATSEITGVQISNTENGLAVILESEAMLSAPITSTTGNALILEISDAVLSLPEGDRFQQFSPTEGVALIEVTSLPGNRVRVSITGADAAPTVSLNADTQLPGLQLSVSPGVAVINGTEEAIQLSVTGEQDEGYAPSSAVSATRTDTPLRDIPQAIQVIPEQVLIDQGVTRIEDALRNAVGVSQQVDRRSPAGSFNIRGFASNGLRNGFEFTQSGNGLQTPIQLPNTIERIEVLRGPDSVLYGAGNPGGTVNYVTKQPLSSPYYAFDITANSNSFYQGSLDLSGPLLSDEANDQQLLYRLTSAYQNFGSFLDFVNGEAVSIAPTLSYEIGEDTRLGLEYEYSAYDQTSYSGLPLDPVIFDFPHLAERPKSQNFGFWATQK
ncbi:MAG: TonB-dependent receptor plug domain-containing protein [Cyanobacteria bacterium J06629_19]